MPSNHANEQTWVYVIRHGETDWNVLKRWMGQGISPLNPLGRRQAERVAARLAGEGLTALYSSDSVRTMQTAQAIAATTGLPIQPDARLREIDVGIYQGFTTAEIQAADGERLAAHDTDPLKTPIPGGESRREVTERVEAAFDEITAAHPGERIAVVSHGGAIGSLLYVLHGRDETYLESGLKNTSITLVRGAPGAWEVVMIGDSAHLDGLE